MQSYTYVFAHLADAFKTIGAWLALLTVYSVSFFPLFFAAGGGASPDVLLLGQRTFMVILLALLLVAHASIGLLWQRQTLLDEPVSSLRLSPRRNLFRVMPYVVGVYFILSVAPTIVHSATSITDPYTSGVFVGSLIWSAIGIYLWVHLAVRWPALAIDDATMTRRRAWSVADPVAGKVFVGMVVVSAPSVIISSLLSISLTHSGMIFYAAVTPIYYLVGMFGLLLNASFFARTYQALTDGGVSSVFD